MSTPGLSCKSFRNIRLWAIFFLAGELLVAATLHSQTGGATSPAQERGPAVGQKIPAFSARDQFGKEQSLASLTGARGLVLLFVRSADW